MIYYLSMPFLMLILLVLQNSISDILFSGIVGVEVSLILVIYAGFRLDVIKGGVISFLLGFFLDCIAGSTSGFHAFIYVSIFLISMIASHKISLDKAPLIMSFTLMCALLKGIIIACLYPLIYRTGISVHTLKIYIPQTLIVILISPVLFHIFYRIETFLGGGNAEQFERT
jgi:rod shape-determining protein MreD